MAKNQSTKGQKRTGWARHLASRPHRLLLCQGDQRGPNLIRILITLSKIMYKQPLYWHAVNIQNTLSTADNNGDDLPCLAELADAMAYNHGLAYHGSIERRGNQYTKSRCPHTGSHSEHSPPQSFEISSEEKLKRVGEGEKRCRTTSLNVINGAIYRIHLRPSNKYFCACSVLSIA